METVKPLSGRVIVVAGGASGIGAACAVAAAEQGGNIVLGYLQSDPHDPAEVVARAEHLGARCVAVPADVRSVADCRELFDVADAEFGRVDGVVVSAGILRAAAIDSDSSDSVWDLVMDVNLRGAARILQVGAGRLVRGGSAVVVSSMTGAIFGWAEHAHYAASKSGLLGLVRAAAVELAPRGVRVNTIVPGLIETPQSLDPVNSLGPEGIERASASIPLGRAGTAADVAAAVCFLLGPTAGYITGIELRVDGGMCIKQPG